MREGDPDFNPDLPWADIRIREALNRAIDREEMIDVAYDGRAEILHRFGMHGPHEGYVPEIVERFEAEYGYDPERAKELMAEAGYPDAFPDPVIPILASVPAGNPEFGPMAELLQVYLDEVGFRTSMLEMDRAALGALGRAREAQLLAPVRNAPIRPSEIVLFTYYTTQGAPFGGYESDRIQELTERLMVTVDPEERERIAAEAFTYLFEAYADMPLAAVSTELAVDPEVVADWVFPGVTSTGLSHWHLIEAAN